MAAQVAEGLAFMHAHCIAHRNLHGRNVLLTATADIKIADTGLARLDTVRSLFCRLSFDLITRLATQRAISHLEKAAPGRDLLPNSREYALPPEGHLPQLR
jgi:serine/threonine protein kinase